MKALYFLTFAVAAAVSTTGSVLLGRSLAAKPTSSHAPTQAIALVGMVAMTGASLLCAGAAATDSQ